MIRRVPIFESEWQWNEFFCCLTLVGSIKRTELFYILCCAGSGKKVRNVLFIQKMPHSPVLTEKFTHKKKWSHFCYFIYVHFCFIIRRRELLAPLWLTRPAENTDLRSSDIADFTVLHLTTGWQKHLEVEIVAREWPLRRHTKYGNESALISFQFKSISMNQLFCCAVHMKIILK